MPAGLKEQSEPYFRYERMIKNYFTGSAYQRKSDPFVWGSHRMVADRHVAKDASSMAVRQ